jgi:hypothetical protein
MTHRFPEHPPRTGTNGRYNYQHKKARAAAAAQHEDDDPCCRCGQPLGPMGRWLHYDHTDDGTAYLGFAHAHCNLRAGAILGNQIQAGAMLPSTRRASRRW